MDAILHHDARSGLRSHSFGCIEEQIRRRLPSRDRRSREDAAAKSHIQSGQTKRVTHLFVRAARCNAGRHIDLVQGLDDSIDRTQLGREYAAVQGLDLVPPIVRKSSAGMLFDLSYEVRRLHADEALDGPFFGYVPLKSGQ